MEANNTTSLNGIKITEWNNVALLVLDRLKSYDKKFDVLIDEIHGVNIKMNDIVNTVSSHSTQLKIYAALTAVVAGVITMYVIGKVF